MDLIYYLQRVPLFSRLSVEHMRMVAEICEERHLASRTRLSRQAELGATFFLVGQGEAIVHRVDERGMNRPVGMLRAGDSFGMTSLFLGEPRDATVTSTTSMVVWMIRKSDFAALVREQPALRRHLMVPEEIEDKLRAPRYPWLDAGEIVTFYTRRHWFTFVRRIAPVTFLFLVILAAIIAAWSRTTPDLDQTVVLAPLAAVYALIALWHWIDWHNDYFAVTNRRITHRERVAFMYESRFEAPLDRVQNINLAWSPIAKALKYGHLTVETAAEVGSMLFDYVPGPLVMRDAIWSGIARAQATRRASQRERMREAIITYARLDTGEELPAPDPEEETADQDGELVDPQMGGFGAFMRWLAQREILPVSRVVMPDGVIWRKHLLFLVLRSFLPLLLSILLGVLTLLAFLDYPATVIASFSQYPYVMLILTVVFMGWLWWAVTDWGNDLYIVTSERIVDIEKRPLFFSEQRREASLGVIQNVNFVIPNMLASLLDYGDVVVQTAGAGEFTFDRVPNPNDVQNEIFLRMEAFREAQREREAERQRSEMAEWFSVYDELKGEGGLKAESGEQVGQPPDGMPDVKPSPPPSDKGSPPKDEKRQKV